MDDGRCRRTGTAARMRAVLVAAAVAALAWSTPAPGASGEVDEEGARDAIDILGVRANDQRVRALFAVPADVAPQTLTADDVTVRVDDQPQQARLRRLDATDIEVGVVVDTAVQADDLRRLQAAVVELALDLPAGATMRVVDATGAPSAPSDVPGAAIAAIGDLSAGTSDDLQRAVATSVRLLDRSTHARTALVVLGRNLDERLRPIRRQPFTRVVHVVTVDGDHDGRPLLDPRSSGAVRTVDGLLGVRPVVDEMSQDVRTTYQARADTPGDVETVTIEVATTTGDTVTATATLDGGGVNRDIADPAAQVGQGGDEPTADDAGQVADTDEGAPATGTAADGVWSDVFATAAGAVRGMARPLVAVALGLVVALMLWLLGRRLRRVVDRAPSVYRVRQWIRAMATPPVRRRRRSPPDPADEPAPVAAGARRPREPTARATRPIAKLGAETREALAQAHLSLRRLALASRRAADSVPDDLFRLSEAQASVALSGPVVDLVDVLTAALRDGEDSGGTLRVRRAARALEIGWQQTAGPATAPAAMREISAALTDVAPNGARRGPQRPAAPVRALNPLVQVGLDHIGLAGRPGRDSAVIARAVTVIDIMRAARLARPVLVMSPGLQRDRPAYDAALDADLADPRQRDAWLGLLCLSVSRGAVDSADRLTRLGRLRDRYREQTGDRRLLSLIDLVLAHPVVDGDTLTERLAIAPDAAERLVRTAVDAGWLSPHGQATDAWVATEVLALFAAPSTEPAHSAAAG